jgi:3-oxoacyl-[acyl-carrier protein] reductase
MAAADIDSWRGGNRRAELRDMTGRFQGKGAIVTGAGRGIGRAIAALLAAEGASVLVADVDDASAASTAAALRAAGGRAEPCRVDVSVAGQVRGMAAAALSHFGRIDILCPNAAVFDCGLIETLPETLWDRLIDVNLKGVFLCVQACLAAMKVQGYGRIVVTSSITGPRTAIPGMAHYAASKGGINGFIRAAALEFAKLGITINGVEPGHVMTPGAEALYDEEFKAAVQASIPLGRFATPEDIGRAVLFLASDDAAYMTGQTFIVDGGVTLPEYPTGFPRL